MKKNNWKCPIKAIKLVLIKPNQKIIENIIVVYRHGPQTVDKMDTFGTYQLTASHNLDTKRDHISARIDHVVNYRWDSPTGSRLNLENLFGATFGEVRRSLFEYFGPLLFPR